MTEHIEKYSGPILRRLALSCLMLCVAGPAHAEETFVQDPAQNESQETVVVFNLEGSSDQQIGALLQRWPQLDATQRRDLLAEVRKRMRTATQVQETQGASAVRGNPPSLTLRIKRAQTRHGYGRPAPRSDAAADGSHASSVTSAHQSAQRPRELVIRTTVTRILPDGRRITRQETLVPSSLQTQTARQDKVDAGSSAGASVVQDSRGNPSGKMRVLRTTVRFGTGFHQRHLEAGSPTVVESVVPTMSAPNALPAPADVLISTPISTFAPEAN